MTLTPTEIESLSIAIAAEMGYTVAIDRNYNGLTCPVKHCDTSSGALWVEAPPYTTALDAIQAAAMERFKTVKYISRFEHELGNILNNEKDERFICKWQLTAIDWCIAFARTAKIWRYKL